MREITSYWFDVLREITSYWFDVLREITSYWFDVLREITSYWFDVLREITSYWFDVLREITSYWFDVQKRAKFQTVILCFVQIPSQLFDLRAVCCRNNELFLVPWNTTLKYLNYFLLGFYSKV